MGVAALTELRTDAVGGATADDARTPADAAGGSRWRPSQISAGAFLVGIIVTAALAWASAAVYDRNESRLLDLRVRELGLVLTGTVPQIQTPLASAAELADATNGSAQRFRAFMAPYVGSGRQFASASLWPLGSPVGSPLALVGVTPALSSRPAQAGAFLSRAERTGLLSVTGILGSTSPRLGYEFNTPGVKHGFAVYAETPLPKDRRSRLASTSAFSDLNYALFLGRSRRTADLLVTNLRRFPITGRQASDVVPFGDSVFTLVVTPNGTLGGTFFESLPWIIAILGALLSLAAALMTDRLARGRRYAEELAAVLDRVAEENRQMYTEQRSIAQTLQHALLPEELPTISGLQTSARYVTAASGIDVGGDWYDVVSLEGRRVLIVVGDVSGHGLRAATTMASLRHASLAYATEDERPASVLGKLSDFVNSSAHDYFATVLCVLVDVDSRRLTAASAGHLAPLLIEAGNARFIDLRVGVPIGVARDEPYQEVSVEAAPQATLLAFTDGLVERRGEVLDVGLERLRDAATRGTAGLDELVDRLAHDLASDDHHDDTAILGLRWQS